MNSFLQDVQKVSAEKRAKKKDLLEAGSRVANAVTRGFASARRGASSSANAGKGKGKGKGGGSSRRHTPKPVSKAAQQKKKRQEAKNAKGAKVRGEMLKLIAALKITDPTDLRTRIPQEELDDMTSSGRNFTVERIKILKQLPNMRKRIRKYLAAKEAQAEYELAQERSDDDGFISEDSSDGDSGSDSGSGRRKFSDDSSDEESGDDADEWLSDDITDSSDEEGWNGRSRSGDEAAATKASNKSSAGRTKTKGRSRGGGNNDADDPEYQPRRTLKNAPMPKVRTRGAGELETLRADLTCVRMELEEAHSHAVATAAFRIADGGITKTEAESLSWLLQDSMRLPTTWGTDARRAELLRGCSKWKATFDASVKDGHTDKELRAIFPGAVMGVQCMTACDGFGPMFMERCIPAFHTFLHARLRACCEAAAFWPSEVTIPTHVATTAAWKSWNMLAQARVWGSPLAQLQETDPYRTHGFWRWSDTNADAFNPRDYADGWAEPAAEVFIPGKRCALTGAPLPDDVSQHAFIEWVPAGNSLKSVATAPVLTNKHLAVLVVVADKLRRVWHHSSPFFGSSIKSTQGMVVVPCTPAAATEQQKEEAAKERAVAAATVIAMECDLRARPACSTRTLVGSAKEAAAASASLVVASVPNARAVPPPGNGRPYIVGKWVDAMYNIFNEETMPAMVNNVVGEFHWDICALERCIFRAGIELRLGAPCFGTVEPAMSAHAWNVSNVASTQDVGAGAGAGAGAGGSKGKSASRSRSRSKGKGRSKSRSASASAEPTSGSPKGLYRDVLTMEMKVVPLVKKDDSVIDMTMSESEEELAVGTPDVPIPKATSPPPPRAKKYSHHRGHGRGRGHRDNHHRSRHQKRSRSRSRSRSQGAGSATASADASVSKHRSVSVPKSPTSQCEDSVPTPSQRQRHGHSRGHGHSRRHHKHRSRHSRGHSRSRSHSHGRRRHSTHRHNNTSTPKGSSAATGSSPAKRQRTSYKGTTNTKAK